MSRTIARKFSDELVLAARLLLVLLFLVYGLDKLVDHAGTAAYMAKIGAPTPQVAAAIAIAMECGAALALVFGLLTRPLALLMAVYTLGTGLIGHPFWAAEGPARYIDAINFYKNISIIGGFLLLFVTGAGAWSVDGWLHRRELKAKGLT